MWVTRMGCVPRKTVAGVAFFRRGLWTLVHIVLGIWGHNAMFNISGGISNWGESLFGWCIGFDGGCVDGHFPSKELFQESSEP